MRTESVCFVWTIYFNFSSARWWVGAPKPSERTPPLGIMRFDCNIEVVEKAVFCLSDVIYLVACWHPVMMICHSSLLRALYLYMIGLLFFPPLYFFGFITHSFVPYLQLMKKNKEKEYFMCPVIHSPQSSLRSLIVVWHKRSCFCGMLGLATFVPTGLHRDSRVIAIMIPRLN